MNYNDEAANVARNFATPQSGLSREMTRHIAAFGRRCAEQMREECAEVASDWHKLDRTHVTSNADMADLIAQAIRRVEVKNTRARAKAPGD